MNPVILNCEDISIDLTKVEYYRILEREDTTWTLFAYMVSGAELPIINLKTKLEVIKYRDDLINAFRAFR